MTSNNTGDAIESSCMVSHSKKLKRPMPIKTLKSVLKTTAKNNFRTSLVPNDIDITHRLPPSKNGIAKTSGSARTAFASELGPLLQVS